ncbi:pRL2-19 [Streptomyces sp. cg2]|uniref:pRL2-19 n=1 Tax=Streptomyces sp. cg2 TaxID=3238799 RepID=UPI0034E218E1
MSRQPTPEEMSHAVLIAILMHHGGSLDLPPGSFEPDAIGRDGAYHALRMDHLTNGGVRFSVVARPDGAHGGIAHP